MYHLEQVTKVYDRRCVLQVERLDIQAGEILALVGPSGAGKSTLLRLLNFVEQPTHGVLRFGNTVIAPGRPAPLALRRRVTTVFQRPILLRRSVWRNVAFGLQLRGEHQSAALIEQALKQVGLYELRRHKARTLSGGEAQRVALARAMVLRPDVLLLDEPTANLDPHNVGLIEQIIVALNNDLGTTVVLVTHNLFQARRLAQRVGLMLEGRIVEHTDTDTFFTSPQNALTASFVAGDMVY
jgi:tungstate transport system ATP-binding protein